MPDLKLVSYSIAGGATWLGAAIGDDQIVNLSQASDGELPGDMLTFLEAGDAALARARELVLAPPIAAISERAAARLHSPVPRPRKVIAVGKNYAEHAHESGSAAPETPMIFAKYDNTIVGPYDDIVLPAVSHKVDYEAELAVVIGTTGRHISEAEALGHVAGYTIANDVSVRDFQRLTPQFTIGKSFDTHCPMGPALVTSDEIADPQNLQLRLSIDGEVLQHASTAGMVHSVASLIAFLSIAMTLTPGDVILTGTPSGVGEWRTPPRWIRQGERVRIEIPGIGHIENLAVAEESDR